MYHKCVHEIWGIMDMYQEVQEVRIITLELVSNKRIWRKTFKIVWELDTNTKFTNYLPSAYIERHSIICRYHLTPRYAGFWIFINNNAVTNFLRYSSLRKLWIHRFPTKLMGFSLNYAIMHIGYCQYWGPLTIYVFHQRA